MTRFMKSILSRFGREERGTASLEFVMVAPLFIGLMIFSIELGFVTMRATLLERGLDIAVREIRLGTGTVPQHDDIKDIICDNSLVINECDKNLRLEMRPADIRAFNALDVTPDCTDAADEAKPVREFTPGQQNQLMLMRACVKYKPLFPTQFLGRALGADGNGQASLIAVSAFVQEPL